MSITLNHHIVLAKDKRESARFLTEVFDLPPPVPQDGHVPDFFLRVDLGQGFYFLDADIAHDFSYYDQSHFINNFSGLNPKNYFQERIRRPF